MLPDLNRGGQPHGGLGAQLASISYASRDQQVARWTDCTEGGVHPIADRLPRGITPSLRPWHLLSTRQFVAVWNRAIWFRPIEARQRPFGPELCPCVRLRSTVIGQSSTIEELGVGGKFRALYPASDTRPAAWRTNLPVNSSSSSAS